MPDLSADHVGSRVSVRRRDPVLAASPGTPSLRDTVGVLESVDREVLTIRSRDGRVVRVPRDQVVAWRLVPPAPVRLRRALDVDAGRLEEISSAGWPALESARLGGWTLRAAGGFTGRANSVLPLGSPGCPLEEALSHVVRWYEERDVVPRFQVPLPLAADLDAQLADHGWVAFDPVRVLVADVDDVLLSARRPPDARAPEVNDEPDDDWLAAYHYRGEESLPPVARQVMVRGSQPVFVTVRDDHGVVAVARGALDPPWIGVTAVEVVARARRLGFGRTVMRDLLEVGRGGGARFTYLQVAVENDPARALYARLGYADHHGYHYRRPPR